MKKFIIFATLTTSALCKEKELIIPLYNYDNIALPFLAKFDIEGQVEVYSDLSVESSHEESDYAPPRDKKSVLKDIKDSLNITNPKTQKVPLKIEEEQFNEIGN